MWAKCKIEKFFFLRCVFAQNLLIYVRVRKIFRMEISRQMVICMWNKRITENVRFMKRIEIKSAASRGTSKPTQWQKHSSNRERVFFPHPLFPFSHAYNVDGFLLVNHFFHAPAILLRFQPEFSSSIPSTTGQNVPFCCCATILLLCSLFDIFHTNTIHVAARVFTRALLFSVCSFFSLTLCTL